MNNYKIFVSTSNDYHRCLLPFAFLFNKFWSNKQEVVILGYDEPKFKLPDNFSFKSLGLQKGPKYYSSDLRKFFQSINDQYFIYTMEDQFILDYVNLDILDVLLSLVKKESLIGRANLTNSIFQNHMGKSHQNYKVVDNFNIIEYTQNSSFRITCEWAIWNKDYMLKYLQGDLTPWEFERQKGSDGYHLIGCKNKVAIRHAEAIRRGKVNENFDFRFVNENQELDNKIKKELYKYLK
tara:strand:- start:820 stop:1530 length:711 start_codon:yes stop_codon:yes gene_type:complete